MKPRTLPTRQHIRYFHRTSRRLESHTVKPVIDIQNATFYRHYPSETDTSRSNPPLFPGLTFTLPNTAGTDNTPLYWSVISPSSLARTTFLQVLAGQHIAIPPTARSYPHLSELSESPQHAVRYVGFDAQRGSNVGGTNVRGAYLSARYESRREETDFSLHNYLTGHTELNALERALSQDELRLLDHVSQLLNLGKLMSMPVANLSNGQTRRARIAKALLSKPEVLLLDGPFMGLDPKTLATMSKVLEQVAATQQPRVIMSLRPEDGVPNWVNQLVVVGDELKILAQGPKEEVLGNESRLGDVASGILETARRGSSSVSEKNLSRDGFEKTSPPLPPGQSLVEMNGIRVAYGDKVVLGDWNQNLNGETRPGLWWSLHRGQRCGIFGPNGSGKTTMLSLITSDHPQTYSLPVKLFGRSRLPTAGQPGISVFDIQKRMGHSSPEVHAFFPKGLTVRRALRSAWADAPMAKPKLTEEAKKRVDACLRWFEPELQPVRHSAPVRDEGSLAWADSTPFAELSFSNQRLILFLRAIVASPDLIILDEALSGIDEATRDKALMFLSHGETLSSARNSTGEQSQRAKDRDVTFSGLSPDQALLVISHSKEDVPGCVREWICLPEPGEERTPRMGTLDGPLELNTKGWNEIWGSPGSDLE